MKNTNKIPSEYDKAIKSGKVEFATLNEGASRKRCIQIVNLMRTIELRNGAQPQNIPFDYEGLLNQAENKGIIIPSTPYESLSKVEKRSLADSLKAINYDLDSRVDVAHGKTFEQILAAVRAERSKKV